MWIVDANGIILYFFVCVFIMHAQFFSRFPLSNFSCDCVYSFIVVFARFPGIFFRSPPAYPSTSYLILFYRISIREIGCSNFNDIHITGFVLLLFFCVA